MGLVKNCIQWYSVYLGFIRLCLRGYWDYWLVQGAIWTKSNVDIRNVILSWIIWNIWVEPNACVFEANGQFILELTMFCLHLMHDWMSVKWTEASHWCLLKRTCLQLTKLKTRYLIWDRVFFFFNLLNLRQGNKNKNSYKYMYPQNDVWQIEGLVYVCLW